MTKDHAQMSALLIDLVDIIQKHVHDDNVRYSIYEEMVEYLFDDDEVLETAVGDDPMFDTVYREHLGDEREETEED